jgi:hypothetical protein
MEIMLKNKCCLYVIISIRFFSITICNSLIAVRSYYASTSLLYSAKVVALLNWWNVQSCMTSCKGELYRSCREPLSRKCIIHWFTVLCFYLYINFSNILIRLPSANHISTLGSVQNDRVRPCNKSYNLVHSTSQEAQRP